MKHAGLESSRGPAPARWPGTLAQSLRHAGTPGSPPAGPARL